MPFLVCSGPQNVPWCQHQRQNVQMDELGSDSSAILLCSQVCLLIQRNSNQQADVCRNPLNSFLRGHSVVRRNDHFSLENAMKTDCFECNNSLQESTLKMFTLYEFIYRRQSMHDKRLKGSKSVIFFFFNDNSPNFRAGSNLQYWSRNKKVMTEGSGQKRSLPFPSSLNICSFSP